MGDSELYCFCRSSDVSRFMICCDSCEEWYHGDCVKVNEKESKYIKRYFCKKCRTKDPKLAIVYKSKHSDDKKKDGKHSSEKERERDKDKEKEKRRETEEERAKRKEREREKSNIKKSEKDDRHKSKSEHKDKHKDKERHRERSKSRERKEKKHKDKHHHHSHRSNDEKTEKVKVKKEADSGDEKPVKVELDEKIKSLKRERSDSSEFQTNSIKVEPTVKKPKFDSSFEEKPSFEKSDIEKDEDSESDDDWKPSFFDNNVASSKKPAKDKTNTVQSKKKTKMSSSSNVKPNRSKTRRAVARNNDSTSSDDQKNDHDGGGGGHCYGHKCKNSTRPGSKYCSDNCGINLATLRILQTLPDRIREWNLTPCLAEQTNRKELEKIRGKQDEVRTRLEQLNVEFHQLEQLIGKGKSQPIAEDDNEDENDEACIHCVTCGADIHTKTAIRHMERCYNKMESQTSFASKYKTQIDDARMFCDFYNPKEDTYCKRLQVLCPEHNPDPRFMDDEVCGCPINHPSGPSFCRLSRRRCQPHHGWDKLRRAELDMERVKQWMKVDELLEQERQVKASMSSRAGVLALLLHSTFNHELEERIQEVRAQQMQQQRKNQQQQNWSKTGSK